jgi:hypothetical protein
MSNTDRSIAAEAARIDRERQSLQLHRMAAYWYVCGYNDHRFPVADKYVDPQLFAEHWLTIVVKPSHPSVQDAFKAFREASQ